MKYSKELKFAEILRNKPISKSILEICKNSYQLNKRIFQKSPRKFKIIICDNNKEIKKHTSFFHKWGTATVELNNDLIIKSPKFIEKTGKWKKKDFQNIMDHEINHVFYQGIFGNYKPLWLCEGLACLAGNIFILNKKQLQNVLIKYDINYKILDQRLIRKKLISGHFPRYPIWANFTKYLVDEFSLNKLSLFLEKYQTNPCLENYHRAFKNIFNASERILFSKFIKSVIS